MARRRILLGGVIVLVALVAVKVLSVARDTAPQSASAQKVMGRQIRIGMVAKSESNVIFAAARQGASDAATELSNNSGLDVQILWRTPPEEDAEKQADAVRELTDEHVDGILVSCSDADVLTPAINRAVESGVVVVCFDSDAPKSKRLCCYGTNDAEMGRLIMSELAKSMDDKGTIAILAGNPMAPNLQARIWSVRQELAKHPGIHELNNSNGIFYNQENGPMAYGAVKQAMQANPGKIDGWAMVGGWALFQDNPLPWSPAGSVKVVACGALPQQLHFMRDGYVDALIAQDVYGWGHRPVEIIVRKITAGRDPSDWEAATRRISTPLPIVTPANLDGYAATTSKQFNH